MKLRPVKPNLRARAPAKVDEAKKPFKPKINPPKPVAVRKRGRPSLKAKQNMNPKLNKVKAGRKRKPKQKSGLTARNRTLSKIILRLRPMRAAEIDILLGRREANVWITRDPKIEALAREEKWPPSIQTKVNGNGSTTNTNGRGEAFPDFEVDESDEVETESDSDKDSVMHSVLT